MARCRGRFYLKKRLREIEDLAANDPDGGCSSGKFLVGRLAAVFLPIEHDHGALRLPGGDFAGDTDLTSTRTSSGTEITLLGSDPGVWDIVAWQTRGWPGR